MDENLKPAEHQSSTPIGKRLVETDRFQRIKEMIELPEEEVSATREPREAEDSGLPLMLMLIFGICLVFASTGVMLWYVVGNDVISLTLGNHFTK